MSCLDADVLIVGAGPVGMTAALALAARGASVLVVEMRLSTSDEPKAISIDDEALRTYAAAGIAPEVLSIIVPGTGTQYYDSDSEPLFHARSALPFRLGFPFKNPFAQPDLEQVLLDALTAHPLVTVCFDTTVVGVRQDDAFVTATVDRDGVRSELVSRYAIGADGGRSTVRSQLGIGMSGRSFDDVWLVVDTVNDQRRERYGMHFADPKRPHVIVPGLDGRCRYEFSLNPSEADFDGDPPFELIRRVMAPYRDLEPADVERAVGYRFHALVADEWRRGRVFLAGDAAHMMPPFAGQGLNSGIRDVANLSWKLSEALSHPRSERFLDSYTEERRPHAKRVTESSVLLGRIVMTTNERVARFRDERVREALATPAGRAFFEHMEYRPPARLQGSLFGGNDDTDLVGRQIGQPEVFDFRRHCMVPFDEMLGTGWALLAIGLPAPIVDEARSLFPPLAPVVIAVPLDDLIEPYADGVAVAIDLDGRLYDEVEPARGRLVLVRPDRFIAHVWTPGETPVVTEAITETEEG